MNRPPEYADPTRPEYGDAWAYESIVGALPGLDVRGARGVAIQVGLFEALVLALGWWYGLDAAVLPGTVAVVVAGGGSVAMLRLAARIRAAGAPDAYTRALFGSSIEVVLGLVAYALLLTYLFAVDAGSALLATLFDGPPPAPALFVTLLVLWDLCYRVGTSWWTAVVSLWATLRLDLSAGLREEIRAVSVRNVAFSALQLALLPFVLDHPVLAGAVAGHVLATTVVSVTAELLGGT